MQSINFNIYDHNFCESKIYALNQHPEYLNSLSSLFITFIGINALMKHNHSFLLSLLYSSLVINGITSFFYHYYNTIGWGLLDRMSMVIIAMSSINLFISNINRIIEIDRLEYIDRIKYINCITISYFTILFTVAGLHMETLFNIIFGIFLGSLIIFVYLIDRNYKLKIPHTITLFAWKGIKYIAISGVFWIVTENLCNEYGFVKYLFGHVWWHIFVSYGGYLISLLPMYLFLHEKCQIYTESFNQSNPIKIKYDYFNIPYLSLYNDDYILPI